MSLTFFKNIFSICNMENIYTSLLIRLVICHYSLSPVLHDVNPNSARLLPESPP